MRIVFVTTQSLQGSTMIGRVLPIAKSFATHHDVHVLGFSKSKMIDNLSFHEVGSEPFSRTPTGKKRLTGIELAINMVTSALSINFKLWHLKPDVVIVFKTLPHNILGVRLWNLFHSSKKVIVDVDDFELSANLLTSSVQRISIHWAERSAAKMTDCFVVASPFLFDHFSNLSPDTPVHLIPTGITKLPIDIVATFKHRLIFLGSTSISSGHKVDLLPEILQLVRKTISDVELTIAGSGDDDQLLKIFFKKRELAESVAWHGRFSKEQLPILLQKHSIIIDPIDSSISNRAKSSYRVSLAGAVGMPVVSSNVGIRPQLLPRELHDRFFAAPNDAADYANKIISLLSESITSAERNSMKKKSEANSWDTLSKKYLNIIEQC